MNSPRELANNNEDYENSSLTTTTSFNFHNHTFQSVDQGQLHFKGVYLPSLLSEDFVNTNISQSQELNSQPSHSFSCMEGPSPHPEYIPSNPPTSPLSSFQSPTPAAFWVGDCYPGFPPYVYQVGPLPLFHTQISQRPAKATSPANFGKRNNLNSHSLNTSQCPLKLPSYCNQNSRVSADFSRHESARYQGSDHLLPRPSNMTAEDAALAARRLSSVDGYQNPNVVRHPFNSKITQSNSQPLPEKHIMKPAGTVNTSNVSTGVVVPNKMRIRWTQDLHEQFVESVNRLGGAEKATPKGILKLMEHEGLTIYHVKSHLQKYRIAKHIPDSAEVKSERRVDANDIPQLDLKAGMQITEALRLQLEVQKRLHEQLEFQRELQMQIEEQGKQLEKMFEQQQQQQQQKTRKNLMESQSLDMLFPDEQPLSVEDVQVSDLEGFGNSHFPS